MGSGTGVPDGDGRSLGCNRRPDFGGGARAAHDWDAADAHSTGPGDREACVLHDLTWRYVELSVRVRVCIEALRRAGRELSGRRGRRGRRGGGDTVGAGESKVEGDASDESPTGGRAEEDAACRLEDGLRVGKRALKCFPPR